MFKKSIIITAAIALCASALTFTLPTWNWASKNVDAISFPKNFEWGATSFDYDSLENGWKSYEADIQKIKELGLTSFCFSIDWSLIEPKNGQFDLAVLERYAAICDALHSISENFTITIILKDYKYPSWFLALGGLEKEENIFYLKRYCMKAFALLHDKVDRWATFFSPDSYALIAYYNGSVAPFKRNMQLAATVMKNTFEAHVQIYKALKGMPGGKESSIGITKNIHQLEPWFPWDNIACKIANTLSRDSFYSFFNKGTFAIRIPLPKIFTWVEHTNSDAPYSFDFIGINYHSHGYIKNFKHYGGDKNDIQTELKDFPFYPEGLYYAIKEMSREITAQRTCPIYITQNGIATLSDDLRTLHTQRTQFAIAQARAEGCDVRGYYYQSFVDDNAWGGGKHFGLLTKNRMLKPGAQHYISIVNKNK